MHSTHPAPRTLDRLLAGKLGTAEAREVIAHLARRCDLCWRYLRGFVQPDGAADPEDYSHAFTSSLHLSAAGQAAVRTEELEAISLWAVLAGTPRAQRPKLVANDPRFHNRPLVLRLLAAAAEHHWREPDRGLAACRLAKAIVEGMLRAADPAYPAGLVRDLQAQTLGALADALRLDGQPSAADDALAAAWDALDEGTGDPLERAALLRREALLRLGQGDVAAAVGLLRPAAATFRLFGERHDEGRTLQKLATAVGHEDPAAGVALAERALTLIEPGREPRLELAARHALIWFLNDSGHAGRALQLLEHSHSLYHQLGDSQPRLLLPWLEARICRGLDRLTAAERGLAGVWHAFHDAGFQQDLTLVSLDLAETYIAQGKTRHAMRFLKTFHATLHHWRMHAEGIAAWLLLMETAAGEAERAQALTREMALYFRRAWRRSVPFRAPTRR